jgi:hypothetical protein
MHRMMSHEADRAPLLVLLLDYHDLDTACVDYVQPVMVVTPCITFMRMQHLR